MNNDITKYIEELAIRADRMQQEGKQNQSEVLWKVIAELEQIN